jgi:hypothetical protein
MRANMTFIVCSLYLQQQTSYNCYKSKQDFRSKIFVTKTTTLKLLLFCYNCNSSFCGQLWQHSGRSLPSSSQGRGFKSNCHGIMLREKNSKKNVF